MAGSLLDRRDSKGKARSGPILQHHSERKDIVAVPMAKLTACFYCSILVLAMTVASMAAATDPPNASSAGNGNSATTAAPAASASVTSIPDAGVANTTALLGVLVMKGVLDPAEAKAIQSAAPNAEVHLLIETLERKGLINSSDLSPSLASPSAGSVQTTVHPTVAAAISVQSPPATQTAVPMQTKTTVAAPPTVVPAIAPLRVLPVDPPIRDGLNAAFKMGAVRMTPYGFVKSTAVYDTSSPNGDDFPFVGVFLSSGSILSTGPTKDPEFHLKARSTRIGANVEWPDVSKNIVLTGRIEGDYEGNFSEVDNRDISSIRSNAFQLRLAYARVDFHVGESSDLYFEGGQDWSIFASSALPSILETTFLGAFYGHIWERTPQFQFGLVQKLGESSRNFKFSPTFAIMMPSSGQIEKLGSLGLAGQIGQGEREGADSGRAEVEGRAVLQFQLDTAKGVAPAQVFIAGFQGRRTSLVPNSSYTAALPANYRAAFPNGFSASSDLYGGQVSVQLPTRWFTLVGSAYRGGDLRFFFGGQVNSFATDVSGLTNLQGPFATLDGGPLAAAGGAVLGTNSAGQVVIAPQRPIRAFGGFVNLGLPLSRWFNADPKGHNSAWQLYLDFGKDQVVHRDLDNPGFVAAYNGGGTAPLPLLMGKSGIATLYYKLNPWCQFAVEQSIYATRLLDRATLYTIAGKPSNEWQDHRTEFGPVFTF